jgi:hypothetical protein
MARDRKIHVQQYTFIIDNSLARIFPTGRKKYATYTNELIMPITVEDASSLIARMVIKLPARSV